MLVRAKRSTLTNKKGPPMRQASAFLRLTWKGLELIFSFSFSL